MQRFKQTNSPTFFFSPIRLFSTIASRHHINMLTTKKYQFKRQINAQSSQMILI